MNIRILSDLHLEFSDRHPPLDLPETATDIVVLAGDIDNGTHAIDWAEQTFPDKIVLYVPGNHEYYGQTYSDARAALHARAAWSTNVRLLDNDETQIGGVRFIGSTLWTDFELFGRPQKSAAIAESLKYVVDFRAIRWSNGSQFTPEQSIDLHREAVAFLEQRMAQPFSGPTVVISHHGPHPGSLHPRWATHLTSAAFISDLTRLLEKADLWIHGHTHDSFDYRANGTRVVANPMGYRISNWLSASTTDAALWVRYENMKFDSGLVVAV